MLNSVRRFLRFAIRAIWFGVELLLYFVAFLWLVLRHGSKPPQKARSRWLQWCSRRTLRVFAVQTMFHGVLPQSGLLVSNHLSYLDILVLTSLTPAVFVSKSEVRHWPVFGWCARMAGTLFVDRTRRGDVTRMNAEIDRVLAAGGVLVLFPEGTSWNGTAVLPFKSSLLEPVVGSKHPLSVSHISYALDDGSVENDICYWGDMTFFPHLVKMMTKNQIRAHVSFSPVTDPASERKGLARQLHSEVVRLKTKVVSTDASSVSM